MAAAALPIPDEYEGDYDFDDELDDALDDDCRYLIYLTNKKRRNLFFLAVKQSFMILLIIHIEICPYWILTNY